MELQGSFCVCAQPMRNGITITPSLIGWAHTKNNPWNCFHPLWLINLTWVLSLTVYLWVVNLKFCVYVENSVLKGCALPGCQLKVVDIYRDSCKNNAATQRMESLVLFMYLHGLVRIKLISFIPVNGLGFILWMCPANERRRYIVTSSLIG